MGVLRNIWNAATGEKPKALFTREQVGHVGQSWTFSYDGEKNLGEIGPARNYLMNYPMLRVRSWQAYVESEVAQIVLNKWTTWVIGTGLKLRCEPAKLVLEQEGVNGLDSEQFNEFAGVVAGHPVGEHPRAVVGQAGGQPQQVEGERAQLYELHVVVLHHVHRSGGHG